VQSGIDKLIFNQKECSFYAALFLRLANCVETPIFDPPEGNRREIQILSDFQLTQKIDTVSEYVCD
jgi:hypothetical protein